MADTYQINASCQNLCASAKGKTAVRASALRKGLGARTALPITCQLECRCKPALTSTRHGQGAAFRRALDPAPRQHRLQKNGPKLSRDMRATFASIKASPTDWTPRAHRCDVNAEIREEPLSFIRQNARSIAKDDTIIAHQTVCDSQSQLSRCP